MTPQDTLDRLVREFESHPARERILLERQAAREKVNTFLKLFDRANIGACLRSRQQAEGFISWLERDLRPLGGINLRSRKPRKAAADNREELIRLLRLAFGPDHSPFQKVDLLWDGIPYFGGDDRQIAKKIISVYYPDETLPIFSTEHMEHFVAYLGLGKDAATLQKYGKRYGGLDSVGKRWDVLSSILLSEKARNSTLAAEDNVYFMYCLYYTKVSARVQARPTVRMMHILRSRSGLC